MDLTNVRKVGIIGGGASGLSTAKLLLAQDLDCTVFERGSSLGGVWAVRYSNVQAQLQRELYEFPDWPLPKDGPTFTPGPVVQKYFEDYAKHFGVWPRIKFNTIVSSLREPGGSNQSWRVSYQEDGSSREEDFDLIVVCIGLFSNSPHIPEFVGRERFKGEVIHISEFVARDQVKGKKVAVVGYGKSATDAAVESAAVAEETTIIFRELHWPVPPMLAGILPMKWAMFNRLMSTLLPLYYRPSGLERVMHSLGKPLVWLWWRIVELLLIVQCRLWSRFGTRLSLVPKIPVEIDTFGESVMAPRPEFYPLLRKGVISPQLTEIAELTNSGLVLENGASVEADMVILATGWKTDYSFLSENIRSSIGFEDDGFYLYRHMVHPDVPNLLFIGSASTFTSLTTCNLQARWLGELIKGHHRLPSREDMVDNIKEIKAWKRRWMPFSGARGARILLHMQHYHDELLVDFGVNPQRKKGVLAPFKEAFAPYQPSTYHDVVSGEWAG